MEITITELATGSSVTGPITGLTELCVNLVCKALEVSGHWSYLGTFSDNGNFYDFRIHEGR